MTMQELFVVQVRKIFKVTIFIALCLKSTSMQDIGSHFEVTFVCIHGVHKAAGLKYFGC